jgi:hypothetical protein
MPIHKFVQKHQILGDDGKPFHLKTHAFRHAKAAELINNGMPLDYVRRWLAHLSAEMTVVYAKIRDDVLRERWEHATAEGVLRLDSEHVPQLVSVGSLEDMNELELERIRGELDATRTEKGYCFKPQKMPCTWAEIACYTCSHYATTPKLLSEFEEMERDFAVPDQARTREPGVPIGSRRMPGRPLQTRSALSGPPPALAATRADDQRPRQACSTTSLQSSGSRPPNSKIGEVVNLPRSNPSSRLSVRAGPSPS